MAMVDKDLSEPYSVFTYRYFLHNWPGLCICAMCEGDLVRARVRAATKIAPAAARQQSTDNKMGGGEIEGWGATQA
jgi:hypothetical protein